MKPYLEITRVPYEEPHLLNLVVRASNGRQVSQIEIYTTPNELREAGSALSVFPRHSADVHLWELGSERPEDRWGFYFRFRAFVTATTGACAIQLRFCYNQELPDRELSEFCLVAEPSLLNRLGRLLERFADLEHEVLSWRISEGELLEKPPGATPAA